MEESMTRMTAMREARKAAGMTQQVAAEALGTTQQTYQRWEKGTTPVPSAMLKDIATLFAVPLSKLTAMPDSMEGIFSPDLHYLTGDEEGFWGHIAVPLDTGFKRWWPISMAERSRLRRVLSSHISIRFLIFKTLDNRLVVANMENIASVDFLDDASDEPHDSVWENQDDRLTQYSGLSELLYRKLTEYAEDFENVDDQDPGEHETAMAFCQDNDINDLGYLQDRLLRTEFHLAGQQPFAVHITDPSLLSVSDDLNEFEEDFFHFKDEWYEVDFFANRNNVIFIEVPLALRNKISIEDYGEDNDPDGERLMARLKAAGAKTN